MARQAMLCSLSFDAHQSPSLGYINVIIIHSSLPLALGPVRISLGITKEWMSGGEGRGGGYSKVYRDL